MPDRPVGHRHSTFRLVQGCSRKDVRCSLKVHEGGTERPAAPTTAGRHIWSTRAVARPTRRAAAVPREGGPGPGRGLGERPGRGEAGWGGAWTRHLSHTTTQDGIKEEECDRQSERIECNAALVPSTNRASVRPTPGQSCSPSLAPNKKRTSGAGYRLCRVGVNPGGNYEWIRG